MQKKRDWERVIEDGISCDFPMKKYFFSGFLYQYIKIYIKPTLYYFRRIKENI